MTQADLFDADVLVCPTDGVLFSEERERFFVDLADRLGDEGVVERWRREVRSEFLAGRVGPAEMWQRVAPGENPAELTAALERRYRPGPLFQSVAHGDRRVWLLATDRSGWLLPRLRRFELERCVERVIVSDQEGVAAPHADAFAPVLEAARYERVLYVDHELANVEAAGRLGLDACSVNGERPFEDRHRAA